LNDLLSATKIKLSKQEIELLDEAGRY